MTRKTLDIRLIGPPDITVDGRALQVDTRKAIAMLAYLAIEGNATRDTLAALFWGDSAPDRARASLRRTLSALRTGVGSDLMATDRTHVSLRSPFACDVARFESEIEETASHDHDAVDVCNRCIPHLDRATTLYRGDFLEGFSVGGAPEFEDWVRGESESLRLRAGQALHRLGTARAAAGDYPGAIRAVTDWVGIDPLHEPAHRMLMLLNAWAGDRPGAMEAYRSFVAILDRELGVSPLEETTELYEAILDDDLPPAPAMRHRVRSEPAFREPRANEMLNRHDELELLGDRLARRGSKGDLIVITGAAWMGKSRLIDECLAQAETAGDFSAVSRAFQAEGNLPFGVAVQVLRAVLPELDAGAIVPSWAREELARLAPQLAPGRNAEAVDRLGELRLFEAFHACLQSLPTGRRNLFVIDDAQWMDPASAQLVAYLARRISSLPMTLIVAAREGEDPPVALTEILSIADLRIDLEPLAADAIAAKVADSQQAALVVERTGGVPLLMLEALSGDSTTAATTGVVRYVAERVGGLSDLAGQVLASAAVLGGVVDTGLLKETSGRGDEEIVDAAEELVAAGLLTELDDGLEFTLDAVAEFVYSSTSLTRRHLLHSRAAAAMGSLPRARTDVRLAAAVAAQYREARDPEAPDWYVLAADLARQVYANAEARTLFETALALGATDIGPIHLELGELAMADGDYPRAIRELRTADAHSDGETLGLIEHRLGEVQRLLGRFGLAGEHYAKAVETHPRPADVYADWALLHHRTGDTSMSLAEAERALELTRGLEGSREMSRALNILGVVTPDPNEAMSYLDRALEMSTDEISRMASLNNKAYLLSRLGRTDEAAELVEEAVSIASRSGHRHREAALRNHLADLHHQAGREEEARAALTEAVTLFADVEAGGWEPEVWLLSQW